MVDSLWNCIKQKQLESFKDKKTPNEKDKRVMWIKCDGSLMLQMWIDIWNSKNAISAPETFNIVFLVPSVLWVHIKGQFKHG